MLNRELIVKEFIARSWVPVEVSADYEVKSVLRNPIDVQTYFPAISIFEDEDEKILHATQNKKDVTISKSPMRDFRVYTELWLEDLSEGTESEKLMEFLEVYRKNVIGTDGNLGRAGNCIWCSDVATGRVLRPKFKIDCIGITVEWFIRYVDNYI